MSGFVCLLLTGCDSTELASDLSQDQAREIIASLSRDGISATPSKGTGARPRFAVSVSKSSYLKAIKILQDEGLPKAPRRTLDDFNSSGLLPPSREMELLKADRAIALDIEDMLTQIPSVVSAHAVVRSYGQEETSVSISVLSRGENPVTDDIVREVAYRVVPGVKPEKTWVKVSQSTEMQHVAGDATSYVPFLGIARVAEDDHLRLASVMTFVLLIFAIIGIIVGFTLAKIRSSHARQEGGHTPAIEMRTTDPLRREE